MVRIAHFLLRMYRRDISDCVYASFLHLPALIRTSIGGSNVAGEEVPNRDELNPLDLVDVEVRGDPEMPRWDMEGLAAGRQIWSGSREPAHPDLWRSQR